MKRKLVITAVLLLIGYATYVHGYYQDNGGKLFLYSVLELFPLWNLGAYLFWPAYWVIALIKPHTDLWSPWTVVGMWIVVHMIYASGIAWAGVELWDRIGYNSGHGKRNEITGAAAGDKST